MNRRLPPSPVPVVLCALLLAGCGGTSPRYRTAESAPDRPRDEEEFRFAAKIREEETREDDRKVDPALVREELSAAGDSAAGVPPYRDKVLLDVVALLGTPYRHGGNGGEGIDCSGFTARVFGNALRRQLPRSTREQYEVGSEVPRGDLQFGDLVFFNTTGRSPSHVGIYLEDSVFAHASVSYGVTLSSLESTYYRKRYVGAKRVLGGDAPPPH